MEKFVTDLGIAAYLLMHGFQVNGKKGRSIYFECSGTEQQDFDKLVLDYMPPSDFYLFDSCLMALKKINPWTKTLQKDKNIEVLTDMGQAAYILMKEYLDPKGYKIIGRGSTEREKEIYFQLPENANHNEFRQRAFAYLGSPFHNFDSNLMTLKKIME